MVTPAYKKRSSELKIKRHVKSSTMEMRESVTYQTGDDVNRRNPSSSYACVTITFSIR